MPSFYIIFRHLNFNDTLHSLFHKCLMFKYELPAPYSTAVPSDKRMDSFYLVTVFNMP